MTIKKLSIVAIVDFIKRSVLLPFNRKQPTDSVCISSRRPVAQLGVLGFSAILLSGCALAPSLDQLNQNLAGMSKQELMYCMGSPARVARNGDMEFATYVYSFTSESTALRCDAHLTFVDGRVTKVRVTGGSPGAPDFASRTCRSALEKCAN
jgi:hypothetical protein